MGGGGGQKYNLVKGEFSLVKQSKMPGVFL
jgi:hypothetical protein